MLVSHRVNVGRIAQDVMMHPEVRTVERIIIDLVVEWRTRIEVAHHHPIFLLATGLLAQSVTIDILHFFFAILRAFVALLAQFAVLGIGSIGLRPGVKGDNVDLLLAHFYRSPSGTVHHGGVGIAGDAFHVFNGITRGDDLRIIVAIAADIPILMAIASSQLCPMVGQIALFLFHRLGRSGIIDGLRLTPYADVGALLFHPFHERSIVIVLSTPHSVLYVPIQQAESLLGFGSILARGLPLERETQHQQHHYRHALPKSAQRK